jgi:hypothetical protein
MSRDYEGMQDFLTAVGRGEIGWAQSFGAYGSLTTSGVPTTQLIWPDGVWNVPPSTGIQMSIKSSSASDGVGGTGIRSVEMHYLDANLVPQHETIILNGTAAVLTIATNIRFVQSLHMVTYGSAKSAVGNVNMYNASGAGQVYSMIEIGSVRCSSSARMIPSGKRAFVSSAIASSVSGTAASSNRVRIGCTYFDGHDYTADSILIPFGSLGFQDDGVGLNFSPPAGPFPAGSVIGMTVATDNKVATVTGDWFGWIENV